MWGMTDQRVEEWNIEGARAFSSHPALGESRRLELVVSLFQLDRLTPSRHEKSSRHEKFRALDFSPGKLREK